MDCINIKFDEDINFHLLRHWTLYDSICHTHDMILSFKLWSSRGLSQLKEFLADLGIPKREYEQNYRDMNIKYKLNIKKQILDKRLQDKYHYITNTIILPTFLLTSGFTLKLSPQDIVYSVMSTLQLSTSSSTSSIMIDLTERFSLALSCLNYHQLDDYLNGIEYEKVYMNKIHYLIETLFIIWSETYFFSQRILKTCVCVIMTQQCLTHLILTHVYKHILDVVNTEKFQRDFINETFE